MFIQVSIFSKLVMPENADFQLQMIMEFKFSWHDWLHDSLISLLEMMMEKQVQTFQTKKASYFFENQIIACMFWA